MPEGTSSGTAEKKQVVPGAEFGLLTVRCCAGRNERGRIAWECECRCGKVVFLEVSNLRRAKSCGCACREYHRKRLTTHGGKRMPEYHVWHTMVQRCTSPGNPRWEYYGGRGITVCDEWKTDFAAFIAHVGPRPSPKHSIDRIDNEKGYEPGNVKWSTMPEQCRNRRSNRLIEYQGETLCLRDWAIRFGLKDATIHQRLHYGWTVERALTTPARALNRHASDVPRLADADVVEVRRSRSEDGAAIVDIAKRFGVSPTVVSHIIHRRSYRHVP